MTIDNDNVKAKAAAWDNLCKMKVDEEQWCDEIQKATGIDYSDGLDFGVDRFMQAVLQYAIKIAGKGIKLD